MLKLNIYIMAATEYLQAAAELKKPEVSKSGCRVHMGTQRSQPGPLWAEHTDGKMQQNSVGIKLLGVQVSSIPSLGDYDVSVVPGAAGLHAKSAYSIYRKPSLYFVSL